MAIVQRVKALIQKIDKVFEGVYFVSLSVPNRLTKFLPGQFTHLSLDEFDQTLGYWPESRVFSIASEPKADHLDIVYSVKGSYTQRMEKELVVGNQVWLKFPYGDFSVTTMSEPEDPLVFVTGGTGISPFIPYLKQQGSKLDRVIHHYHGLRKNGMLIFQDSLEMAAQNLNFKGFLRIEDEEPKKNLKGWNVRKGRLSLEEVLTSVDILGAKSKVFLSGPPGMIFHFKEGLKSRGISEERIKIDSWE